MVSSVYVLLHSVQKYDTVKVIYFAHLFSCLCVFLGILPLLSLFSSLFQKPKDCSEITGRGSLIKTLLHTNVF